MKLFGYLAGAAIALAACVPAPRSVPDIFTVSDVRVDNDLSALTGSEAARFWGNLAPDLSSAIAQEFAAQTSPEGWQIVVDIDEIALSSIFASPIVGDEARLTGDVALIDPASQDVERSFTVSATANEVAAYLPGGVMTGVSPDSEVFYGAVVRAFARGVYNQVLAGPPEL